MKKLLTSLIVLFVMTSAVYGQWEFREIIKNDNITYPKTSKKASISQEIGITTVTVNYHSPAVRNRIIWGGLLPFGKIWRAGAEESTTIVFMDKVMINNKFINAGKYGIHMIPYKDRITVIFSKNHTQWGSFFYDKSEDELRIDIPIQKSSFNEYLKYDFEAVTENKMNLIMKWDEIEIKIPIEVNEIETTLSVIRDELRTLPRFSWRGSREAALYCWLHDTNLDEALSWINLSISYEERFENVFLKSQILSALGKTVESNYSLEKALTLGDLNDMVFLARESIGHHNSLNKAIEVLDLVISKFPNSHLAFLYKGNAYGLLGDLDKAKINFDIALKLSKSEEDKNLVINRMKEFSFQ